MPKNTRKIVTPAFAMGTPAYESNGHNPRVSVKVATTTQERQVRAALTSYRYVRNPMYIGGLVLWLSEALAFRSMATIAWAVL